MTAGSRPLGREEIFSGNMQDTTEAFDKFEDLKLDPTCGGDLDNIQLNELAAFEATVMEQPAIYPKTEVPSTSPIASVPARSYTNDYMTARPSVTIGYSQYESLPDHGWTTAPPNTSQACMPTGPYAMGGQPRVSNNLLNHYMATAANSPPPVCATIMAPEVDAVYSSSGMGKAHSFPNVHTPTTMAHAQMAPPQPQPQYVSFENEWPHHHQHHQQQQQQQTAPDPMAQINGAVPGNFSPVYTNQRTPPYPEPPAYQFGCPSVMEERERSSSYPGVASPWSNSMYSPPIGQQGGAYCPSNYSSPPHSLTDLSAAAPNHQVSHSGLSVNVPGHSSQSLYTTAPHDGDMIQAPAMHAHSYPGCATGQIHFRPGVSNPSSPLSASRETSPLTFNTLEWNEVMSEPNVPPPLVNSHARAGDLFDFRDPNSRASSLSPNADQIPLPNANRGQPQAVGRNGRRTSNSGRRARNRNGPRSARSLELWQFLYVVLTERAGAGALMWLDQSNGLFKVIDQERLSELWSDSKRRHRDRPKVTRYSNLTRTLRYYYGRNILRKGERDHVYQFLYERMEPWISNRSRH